MIKNIIYFLSGILLAVLSCIYFYSGIIHSYKETISSLSNANVNQYKYLYSDKANRIIKVNNSSIQTLMLRPITEESSQMAQLLLASSVFLNEMTYQEPKTVEDVFLTTALFYKKTLDKTDFIKQLPMFREECNKHHVLVDCSIENVRKLTDLIH